MCIYSKQSLNSYVIDTNTPQQSGAKDLWLTIQRRKLPSLIISCIYRHPKTPSPSFDYIDDIPHNMCIRKKPIFILGDLNDELQSNNRLSRILKNNHLSQLINKPTRITPTSATLLDVIINNKPDIVLSSDVTPSFIADHGLITTTINISKTKSTPTLNTFRDFSHYDKDTFCLQLLSKTDYLNKILNTDNAKMIRRPAAPWLTTKIREIMGARNDAQAIFKVDRLNVILQNKYTDLNKHVKTPLYKVKREYYQNQITTSKNNISRTWKIIKNVIPSQNKKSNASITENIQHIAEDFNNFFGIVGKYTFDKTQRSLQDSQRPPEIESDDNFNYKAPFFRSQSVDVNTVILIIKHLNETKSFGSNKISLRFFTDSMIVIAFYLTVVINTPISTVRFPTSWKHATVISLFKSGDKSNTSNYRPISLLPIFSI